MNSDAIREQLTRFLHTTTGNEGLTSETDLLATGVIESLLMMDLVIFIETTYGIRLDAHDFRPETFRTINAMTEVVAQRLRQTDQFHAA